MFAERGWLVEVTVAAAASQTQAYRFVVGRNSKPEAEKLIRAYPGVERDDRVKGTRELSKRELEAIGLKAGEVRRYLL
jgi:hypothetical protein